MTDTAPITIVIPVGPERHHAAYLDECLDSIAAQTVQPEGLVFIDDMHGLTFEDEWFEGEQWMGRATVRGIAAYVWHPPWRLGVAHAFNAGVALADEPLCITMGADDTLHPQAVEAAWGEYQRAPIGTADLTYYFFGVRYMDTGEEQTVPCAAAMVSKRLWQLTGGYPTEAASGASDAALLSTMIGNSPKAGLIQPIANAVPLYNYRRHANTDTAARGPWQGVILETRNLVTAQWKPPTWGRFS